MAILNSLWKKLKSILDKLAHFVSSLFRKQIPVPIQTSIKATPAIDIPPNSLVPKAADLVIGAQKLINNPTLSTPNRDELRRLMWYVNSYIDPYKINQPANYDRKVEDWLLLLQQEIEKNKDKGPSPSR
jgi:hypothetical protein